MDLFILPLDTQFYRDGLPFDAGRDSEATGVFPPYPRTLYGALRTVGMAEGERKGLAPDVVSSWMGDRSQFGEMKIKGPVLARLDEKNRLGYDVLLPFPADAMMAKDNKTIVQLAPVTVPQGVSLGLDPMVGKLRVLGQPGAADPLVSPTLEEIGPVCLFHYDWLWIYLTGRLGGSSAMDMGGSEGQYLRANVAFSEYRIGIARDPATRTAREAMLYRVQHVRLNDRPEPWRGWGFSLSIENAPPFFPEKGSVRLGGESRPAGFVAVETEDPPWWQAYREELVAMIAEKGRFKVFLITPGLFEKGAIPDVCVQKNDAFIVPGSNSVGFILVGAAIPKPFSIGGWDLAANRPKPMLKAAPSGSVYFFEADPKSWGALDPDQKRVAAEDLYDRLNFISWCSDKPWGSEYGPGKESFGIGLIGGW